MAKLYFRYGAMGSSKTANAVMVQYNYQERGQKALMLKPQLDNRDGERVVGSRTRLDVEMLSESQQVDAVVVTALGLTRKEKSLGYAVSTVGSEDLNNTVTNNWLNGMAGKVAGRSRRVSRPAAIR